MQSNNLSSQPQSILGRTGQQLSFSQRDIIPEEGKADNDDLDERILRSLTGSQAPLANNASSIRRTHNAEAFEESESNSNKSDEDENDSDQLLNQQGD